GGLPNFFHKIQTGETITIGYIGGSITRAEGYRILVTDWLKDEYNNPNINGINAGIGGTGSPLGVFRIQEGVLDFNPDLVFIEFAVNDGSPSNTATIKKAMEGMVRQIWKQDPTTEICFIYSIRDEFLTDLQNDTYPISAAAHDEVAAHYNVASIHLGLEVAKMEERGELIFEKSSGVNGNGYDTNGDLVFSRDGVHPTAAGHGLYRDAIARSFLLMQGNNTPVDHIPGNPHLPDNWEYARMLNISELSTSGITEISEVTHPTYFGSELKFYTQLGRLLLGEESSDEISFTFEGRMVGMWDPKGPKRGDILAQIDQGAAFKIERFDGSSHFWRDNYFLLDELVAGEHTVSFKVHPDRPDKRAILNNKSEYDNNPSLFDGQDMVVGRILVLGVGEESQNDCENTYIINAGQNQTLDCGTGIATLNGQTNANAYEWITPSNQVISQSLQINATEAGTYTFVGIGDQDCRIEDQVIVNPCIDCSEPVIDHLTIINSTTNEAIGRLEDGGFINIFDYPGGLNLNAEVISCPEEVKSVRFVMTGDGTYSQTESKAPYAFFGDINGNYRNYFFTPGSYTLTITPYSESGANGTAGTPLILNFTVINQEADPCEVPPTLGITGELNLTCLNTESTLTAVVSEEGTYTWTGPEGFSANTPLIQVSVPGIYEVTFTSVLGCEVAKAIVVTPQVTPTLTVEKSGDIPCNGGEVTLTASSDNNGTYSWIGPNNFTAAGPSITVGQAGGYTVTLMSQDGCQISKSVAIIQQSNPEITITGDQRISCDEGSSTLSASATGPGSFSWTGPDDFISLEPTITASMPGNYEVTFLSDDNCQSSKQVEVYQADDPYVYAGEDIGLSCQTFNAVLTANVNEEGTFYWAGPNNFESYDQEITVSEAGEYVLYFSNTIGCENMDMVKVTPVITPSLSLPSQLTIPCDEEGIGLSAGANTEGSYQWSGSHGIDGGQETLYVSMAGTYTVEFTSWDGCSVSAQTVVDSIDYDPVVGLSRILPINCERDPVNLTLALQEYCGLFWTGPDGFYSTELIPEIRDTGEYILF
ncbi:MAG: SGNH/GDSL hydrolase family protein, partial [Bacteroidota bacterium]